MKLMRSLRVRKRDRADLEVAIDRALKGEVLSFDETITLLDEVERKLYEEPQLIKLKGKTAFIGDTHGDFEVSVRALSKFLREGYNVVFLGDYVDRGAKQIENVNYLLASHLRNDKVVLLRGNHESPVTNMSYGFMEVLYHIYGSEWPYAYIRYNEVFSNLPYAALVDGILALHGGIAEGLRSLKQITSLRKKDMIPSDKIAFQILWNDPSESVDKFGENFSRGGGVKYYGRAALEDFLRENKLKVLMRSHEAYPDGYTMLFKGETGIGGLEHKLISIFSCSYYGVTPTAAVYDGRKVGVLRI
ncbi:MAG: metallophosphoesterase [Candidatus Korarchaeum sp.]|nr:metallophosphoesterase [Candidatus Korarchaeum sp.]MDW8035763.1 metallophosphoesterase [Candidatus Korarchaeum sp.]